MSSFKLSKTTVIEKVPTNIVTGFLGSGKSTLIQSLLTNKDNDEHWVVLINEFGEVGLDEKIIEANLGAKPKKGQIQISQIAGGCLCCANGVPFQVALVQLLKQQDKSPARLIIEPTGLGHPKQIINQLAAQPFIELQTVFTVVDPRKVKDARYAEHELYTTQIAVADVVVCNKQDAYVDEDLQVFKNWMNQKDIQPRLLLKTAQGQIDESLLGKYQPQSKPVKPKLNLLLNTQKQTADTVDFMEYQTQPTIDPIQIFEQNIEGFFALGFIMDESFSFDEVKVVNELMGVDVIRIKALIKIGAKVLIINCVDSVMTTSWSNDTITQSRFQFISHDPISAIDVTAVILTAIG